LRERARASIASHALRPLLVASLVLATIAGIARSDQQSAAMQGSTAVSPANSAYVADAGETGVIPARHRTDLPTRGLPMFRAASSSPRVISGVIADEPIIGGAPDTAPLPTPEQRPTRPSTDVTASAHPNATKSAARRTKAPAPAYTATIDEAPLVTIQAAPLFGRDAASASRESLPSPVAARNCTQSVAALGLCRAESSEHDR
jgi:hypothetical protein